MKYNASYRFLLNNLGKLLNFLRKDKKEKNKAHIVFLILSPCCWCAMFFEESETH